MSYDPTNNRVQPVSDHLEEDGDDPAIEAREGDIDRDKDESATQPSQNGEQAEDEKSDQEDDSESHDKLIRMLDRFFY